MKADFVSAIKYILKYPGSYRFRWRKISFFFRQSDRVAVDEILKNGEYSFVGEFISDAPHPLVIDAGANVGLFSIQVFSIRPDCKIVAVEPGPETFEVLKRTQAANPQFSWDCRRLALWSESGEIAFIACGASTGHRITTTRGSEAIMVSTVTLEQLAELTGCGSTITLLRMDIEGAEVEVLKASIAFFTRVECLIVELHDPAFEDFCLDLLRLQFTYCYRVSGRNSQKPLIVCCRKPSKNNLFRVIN